MSLQCHADMMLLCFGFDRLCDYTHCTGMHCLYLHCLCLQLCQNLLLIMWRRNVEVQHSIDDIIGLACTHPRENQDLQLDEQSISSFRGHYSNAMYQVSNPNAGCLAVPK